MASRKRGATAGWRRCWSCCEHVAVSLAPRRRSCSPSRGARGQLRRRRVRATALGRGWQTRRAA
eukprot:2347809-Alexandrium_andersonii.AAC.1